ncbi:MAG: trypsin-like peptidase domain-containing protein, partial [Bacteroidales bacterium]|nr:trypsin-like peptidase domain-containing protein [Bacteroidales bacterium]
MKKIIISSIILLLSYCVTHGQITTGEEPISFQINVPVLKINDNTLKRLPSFDMERVKKEDVEDEANGIPPRFGYKHEVDYNLYNSGEWTELPNGDKLWRLIISSPDALSINLLYDKFWLPDGAKFWVYSNDNKQSIGAITSANNSGTKNNIRGFATNLVFGDQITLEYYLPNHVTEEGIISVAYVVHGYRYILTPGNIKDSYRQSADCQVNINCEEGQSWQNEKNAVVKIIIINRVCTGFLVNNTKEDFYPYVITANHCLCKKYVFGECDEWHDAIRDPNLDYWTFEWHYESPKCENAVPIKRSTVGAKLVANNSISDFALLDLSEENNSYGSDPRKLRGVALHYLGWDRSGSPGTGGVGIHHPNGNIKKISTYTMKPQSTGYTNDNEHENGAHWRVVWASTTYNGVTKHGTTEGGSSGSPLINSDRKVIGQLHGGYSNCTENGKKRPDWYGKFSVSWTGYDATQSQRRLSDWLAPNSSRPPEVLGGIDKPAIPFDPIEGVDLICSPEVYELSPYYFDEDSPVANWRITPDSDLIITSQTTNVNMVFVRAIGSYYGQTATLTATVNGIDYHKEIKACPPSSIKIVGSETICVTETYTLHGDDRFQNLSWDVTEGFTIDDNDDNWVRIIACPKGQPGTLTAIFKGVPIAQILI